MDCAVTKKMKINPKVKAGLLSQIFFIFALKPIFKGARHELDKDDVYEILNHFRSDKLGDRLDALWRIEMKKPKPCIWRPFIKMFGLAYALIGIVDLIIGISFTIINPLLMGKVISYFDPNTQLSKENALIYTMELIACTVVFSIYDSNYFFILEQLSMRIRIACCSLMYRKCLRLDSYSLSEFAGGKALTIMTKDVLQFDGALDYGHAMFHCLLKLIIMTYIMQREIGDAAYYGVSVLFISLPVFGFAAYCNERLSELDRVIVEVEELNVSPTFIKRFSGSETKKSKVTQGVISHVETKLF